MEQMQQYTPNPSERESDIRVGLRNKMQIELALKHKEDFDSFLEKHGLDFKNLIDEREDLIDMYAQNPSEAIKQAEEIIYH